MNKGLLAGPPARWGLRVGFLACLGLAAAGLAAPRAPQRRVRMVVIDASGSLVRGRGSRRDWLRDGLADLDPEDQAGLILVGGEAELTLAPQPVEALRAGLTDGTLQASGPLEGLGRGTDLGAGLELAGRLLPDEVLLISDGRDTQGQALTAAAGLAAAGQTLSAWAPDAPPPRGVRLSRLSLPERANAFQELPLELEVSAHVETRFTLSLEEDRGFGWTAVSGAPARGRARPGRPFRLRMALGGLPAGSLLRVRAEARALGRDDASDDDRRLAALVIGGGRRAVALGPVPELRGLAVERLGDPAELGPTLAVGPTALIVIGETPAAGLAPAVPALTAAVEAGAGLIVLGCEQAFGPGGYAESELERLLPLNSGPASERQDPLALVLALDASGSMARERLGADGLKSSRYRRALAAALPLELLQPQDLLGVVLFDEQPRLATAGLAPPPPDLLERLSQETPRGGTQIGPALLQGLELLRDKSGLRRLILASDSEDPEAADYADPVRAAAATLPPDGLEVLLVRIGGAGERSGGLAALAAAIPGARVASAADAGPALAKLVEGELQAAPAETRRGAFPLASGPATWPEPLALPAQVPAYVPTVPNRDVSPQILARVQDPDSPATEDLPPAIAVARRGLGQVAALPLAPASAGGVLGGLAERLAAEQAPELTLTAERQGPALIVRADGDLPSAELAVRLSPEGGPAGQHALSRRTPDRAELHLEPAPGATTQVSLQSLSSDSTSSGRLLASTVVASRAQDELAAIGPADAALAAIAAAGGGRLLAVLPTPEQPLPRARLRARPQPLAPWLAGLALILFLADAGLGVWIVRRETRRWSQP